MPSLFVYIRVHFVLIKINYDFKIPIWKDRGFKHLNVN